MYQDLYKALRGKSDINQINIYVNITTNYDKWYAEEVEVVIWQEDLI